MKKEEEQMLKGRIEEYEWLKINNGDQLYRLHILTKKGMYHIKLKNSQIGKLGNRYVKIDVKNGLITKIEGDNDVCKAYDCKILYAKKVKNNTEGNAIYNVVLESKDGNLQDFDLNNLSDEFVSFFGTQKFNKKDLFENVYCNIHFDKNYLIKDMELVRVNKE